MEPLKIKLEYADMEALTYYLRYMAVLAKHPQASTELIVLAEFSPTAEKRMAGARLRHKHKVCPYKLPVSVARILHQRWQQEVIDAELQIILGGIDYELTQRGMKPDPDKPQII